MFTSFLKLVCSWLLIFGFAYLLAAFNQNTFDTSQWIKEAKNGVMLVTIYYTIISFFVWLFRELT